MVRSKGEESKGCGERRGGTGVGVEQREEQRGAARSTARFLRGCPRVVARRRCGARAGRASGAERGRPRWLPGRRGAFAARRRSEVTALWERAGGGGAFSPSAVSRPGGAERPSPLPGKCPPPPHGGEAQLPGAAPRAFCRKCPGSSGSAIRLRKDGAGRDVLGNEAAGKHNKQQICNEGG